MSSLNQIVANNIVKLRKITGLSQLELVALSNVTPEVLCNIEHAIGNPELRTLDKIADALEVPTSKGFSEEEITQFEEYLDRIRKNLEEWQKS